MKRYTEEQAVAALQRVAKRWPETLWIFAGDGSDITVLRTDGQGHHAMTDSGCVDQDYIVGVVTIPNDGGGW